MSVSGGDNGASHVAIVQAIIDEKYSLVQAERHLAETLGRPMTDEERADLARAYETAQALEREHGPDYHGFGDPPPAQSRSHQ